MKGILKRKALYFMYITSYFPFLTPTYLSMHYEAQIIHLLLLHHHHLHLLYHHRCNVTSRCILALSKSHQPIKITPRSKIRAALPENTRHTVVFASGNGENGYRRFANRGKSQEYGLERIRELKWQLERTTWHHLQLKATQQLSISPNWPTSFPALPPPPLKTSKPRLP
ncbi:hypothetical protein HYC85_001029 [Camellia sinensis]|uniref:Uncharacterized protein n=1 Tax=Camellia sinensis TaxID=4442 RepID=A0A7J7I483_CAMSI|nr:hypothetical protein HYC85_001029 [Camellia sinensis]